MKAATIDRFKTPAVVHDVATPPLEDDAVLLRVTAAGVNPVDWKIRDGEGGERSFPLTLGQDFSGVVERVGPGVTRVKEGDRVFGCARDHGAYAEFTEIRDGQRDSPFAKIPEGVSDALAAALPTPVLTALASLEALGVGKGTELLVVGAAGAVGSAALQLARNRDAIVTAAVKPGQESGARANGASTVVTVGTNPATDVAVAHEDPFEAILDLVSNADQLKALAPLLARGGTILTTIHVADEAWFAQRGIRAINMVVAETPQSSPEALDEVAALVRSGSLTVEIGSERPLDDANAVLDGIKAGEIHGKVILRP